MDAIAASRNAILQDIRTYERTITDLKGRLNTLTPIGRLPTELLSEVLVATMHACYERDVARPYRPARLSCIDLTLVCRQWHATAFKTPRFWSYIYINKPSIFAKLVQLSMNAPLVVDLRVCRDAYHFTSPAITATDIAPLMNRVRSITTHGGVSHLETLFQAPNNSLMLLEHLSLSTDGDRPSNVVSSSQSLLTTIGPTPRLHSVHLTRVPFLWSDPVFAAKLTSLSIHERPRPSYSTNSVPQTDHGPMEGFLAMLESISPTLQSLTLDEAIPIISSSATEPSPVANTFSFPFLRSLTLVGETNGCAQLLNYISTQCIEDIHIKARGKPGAEVLSRTVSELLRSRPLVSMVLRNDMSESGMVGLSMEGWRSSKTTTPAPVAITFFSGLDSDPKSSPLYLALKAAPTLFSHVQSLKAVGLNPTPSVWTLLFSCTTNVRTLAVVNETADVVKALRKVHNVKLKSRSSKKPRMKQHLPLPFLTTFQLDNVPFAPSWDDPDEAEEEEVIMSKLLDWVMMRCNYGVPLQKMRISACKHIQAEDVSLLREVVVDVDWDGWERETTTEEDFTDEEAELDFYDSEFEDEWGLYMW